MFKFEETQKNIIIKEKFRFEITRIFVKSILLLSWFVATYLFIQGNWKFFEFLIWIALTSVILFPLSTRLYIKYRKSDSSLYINYSYFPFILRNIKLDKNSKLKFIISQKDSKSFFKGNYYDSVHKEVHLNLNQKKYLLTVFSNKKNNNELQEYLENLSKKITSILK